MNSEREKTSAVEVCTQRTLVVRFPGASAGGCALILSRRAPERSGGWARCVVSRGREQLDTRTCVSIVGCAEDGLRTARVPS